MEKITKEQIQLVFDNLSKLFNSFFPGIFIMEIFFSKGLFSDPPTNLIGFILFMFWAAIFSFPLIFINPNCIENIILYLCRRISKILKKEIKVIKDLIDTNYEEYFDDAITLGYILIQLLILFISNKLILHFELITSDILSISITTSNFLLSMIVLMIMRWPIAILYMEAVSHISANYVKIYKL